MREKAAEYFLKALEIEVLANFQEDRLHGSSAGAIAFYDPKVRAVIMATYNPSWSVGQTEEVTISSPE